MTHPASVVAASEEQPPTAVKFPLAWLAEQNSPALYYRALCDVVRDPDAAAAHDSLPLTSPAALLLALEQHPDGSWNQRMLAIPNQRATAFEGVGTIPAVQRLLEYGWSHDSPPITHARRILFRLLAEDDDPSVLFELRLRSMDEDTTRRARAILREAAAATLAQAGFEGDPRLRGAARRILERINAFMSSPVGEKPWVRVGNKQVLSPEAYPPSFYALRMLSFMPLLRHEQYSIVERLYDYLIQPLPRQQLIQVVGRHMLAQPHLVLGDHLPHRNAVEADVPFALLWLETMARLNFLKRNENWSKMLERFLDDCDKHGVWHPHKGMEAPHTRNPFAWSIFPLSENTVGQSRWADITVRIGIIARLLGREIQPS